MSFTITPAVPSDASAMVPLGMASFRDDKVNLATFRINSLTPEELDAYAAWRGQLTRQRMDGPGKHYFKAVDSATGLLAGYIGMFSPQAETRPRASIAPAPVNVDHVVDEEVKSKLDATKARLIGGREDVWYIQSMAVHPDFQRRGIAKALVDRALAEVDKAGHECYLESTMVGQALYRRCGFQAAADIPIESVEYTFQAMIRPSSKTMVDNKGIVG